MDKSRPKPNQGSSWNDHQDNITNPNRRQDEDQDTNVESQRGGQRASNTNPGSSESSESDRDEQLHGERQSDTSRRQRQSED